MKKVLRIGIVGCGAIGTSIAKSVTEDFQGRARICALYDIDTAKAVHLSLGISKKGRLFVNSLKRLIRRVDLVVESASAKSSYEIAEQVLKSKRDILILSVGGVVNNIKKLEDLAFKKNAKIYIPSGAICGIDGLKAASVLGVKQVTLTTRKYPHAFKGVKFVEDRKIDLDNMAEEEKVLFEGSAVEAIQHFPQNINVAGILSLAGIGAQNTKVKIIASKKVLRNIHEVEIESDAAKIIAVTQNQIHPDNPKTSYLAVLSALAVLRQILQPLHIGT